MTRREAIAAFGAAALASAVAITPAFGAVATIREATAAGPEANARVGIQAAVDVFRTDLGDPNNGNFVGDQGAGRRAATWDGADNDSAPARMPGNFFNAVAPRGLVMGGTDPRIAFQQSADATPSVPGTPTEFGNVNATYPTAFASFSSPRLFSSLTTNAFDIEFYVAGTSTPAEVTGFGAVFTDVDVADSSKLEFFDRFGTEIFERSVLATSGDESLSFLGVTFTSPDVARVRITSGNAALGPNDVTQTALNPDIVVLDDFTYGEPHAQPTPALSFSSADFAVAEDAGSATISVERSGDTEATAKVGVSVSDGSATAGSDYEATGGTLTFGPGETQKTLTLPIAADSRNEGTETVNLSLDSATSNGATVPSIGPNATATLSIANAPDAKAPVLELAFDGEQRLAGKRPSVEVRAFCDESCSLEASGALKLKGGVKSPKGGLTSAAITLPPSAFETLTVPLTRKGAKLARRALRGGGRATAKLTFVATDAAGNETPAKGKVRLR